MTRRVRRLTSISAENRQKSLMCPPAFRTRVEPRGRGRPRLGVIAKEVTLLPRHWDWLNVQPGGASVALRKLVDEARKTSGDRDRVRAAQEAAYRFMSAIAGNLPGFEEATRALFAYDRRGFTHLVANWPEDVRDYAVRLAFADRGPRTDLNRPTNRPHSSVRKGYVCPFVFTRGARPNEGDLQIE